MTNDESRGRYVPVLTLGGTTTQEQRERNYALYLRLRDGVPEAERTDIRDGVGLHVFVFEVPLKSCSHGTYNGESTIEFRLDKDGECYRRLLSYIVDHFPTRCEADDKLAAMTTERDAYRAMLCDVIASAHPNERDHPAMSKQWKRAGELLKNGPAPSPPRVDDESRCAVCQWPLAETAEQGCVRGNCSMRPRPTNFYAPERAARERQAAIDAYVSSKECTCEPVTGHRTNCPRYRV